MKYHVFTFLFGAKTDQRSTEQMYRKEKGCPDSTEPAGEVWSGEGDALSFVMFYSSVGKVIGGFKELSGRGPS